MTQKAKGQEQILKGWNLLVEEFFKKPLRMVAFGLVVSALTAGGNFLGQWFIKVINMNKRVTVIELTVKKIKTDDSLNAIKEDTYREQQRNKTDSLMIYVARIQGALGTGGIHVSRMSSLKKFTGTNQ